MVACCCSCKSVTILATVLSAIVLGWLNAGGISDGTIPAFHLLEPHGFSSANIPSLAGKTALVTGASSGLGLGVARSLAKAQATLIVTARSAEKCKATLSNLRAVSAAADITCVLLELLDLKHVSKAAKELAVKLPKLDMLVLNAGIMGPPTLLVSDDGFEQQFQVNHLSQFKLLQTLMPSLLAASAPRVVFVSSIAHYFSPKGENMLQPEAMLDAEKYDPNGSYGWSKLCNILTARELARRQPSIMSHAVHPGGVQGKLLRYSGMSWASINKLEGMLYWDIDTAANTVMRPLVEAEFVDPTNGNGRYLVPIARERKTSAQGEDATLAKSLWEFSERAVAEF